MKSYSYSVLVIVLVSLSSVLSEPPVRNQNAGWGSGGAQPQQQNAGGYANNGGQNGGWGSGGQQQQQQQVRNAGGWGMEQPQKQQQQSGGWGQQAQTQSAGNGWGQQAQTQSAGNGWGMEQQMTKDQGNGWGSDGNQLNLELDSANLKNFNPRNLFRSIIGIPRRIISFFRESGLYILLIPLIIILPLMLLAFNAGRLIGGMGWGWTSKRSLSSTVESGIVGYLKSPVWQKIGETLMNEHVFANIMKSVDEFNKQVKQTKKNW